MHNTKQPQLEEYCSGLLEKEVVDSLPLTGSDCPMRKSYAVNTFTGSLTECLENFVGVVAIKAAEASIRLKCLYIVVVHGFPRKVSELA